uniref:Uncharacterized protein n=1 Tax=Rhodosorus marinus TaxID=101924 RepID=A0A7S0G1H1_9RHOD|mmetsp:Transcript_1625/g.2497  ORF Transcript_1625/g.2497 Transcript_1625/m.2497 type:complete len:207 (+) Transcript_1625:131-751(+)
MPTTSTKDERNKALREGNREISKAQRDLGKLNNDLRREEERLKGMIKEKGKKGDVEGSRHFAALLVQNRKKQDQLKKQTAQVGGMTTQMKMMNTQKTMAETMGKVGDVMSKATKQMDAGAAIKMTQDYQREAEKLNMFSEMMDDGLDNVVEDYPRESEDIVNQIFDELKIDQQGAMKSAPTTKSNAQPSQISDEDAEIEKLIAGLR